MNTLKQIGLFHTPKDLEYITNWIESFPKEDRAGLWTAACMAWNLAVKKVNEGEENENSNNTSNIA